MNSSQLPFAELREQAIALRRAGKSRREIAEILGITSNKALTKMVAGEPPAAWTLRPNAKDDLRAEARQLRAQGLTYHEIAAKLGVSKSSVSLWVRDLPRTGRLSSEEWRKRAVEGHRAYWEVHRPLNEARRQATRSAAAAEIGSLTDRETIIAGAIAYWCEGTKNKPYRRSDRVVFMNSDPDLTRFFLRFLDAAGVGRDQLIYQLHIHENADAEAAQQFWQVTTGAIQEQFRKPNLKRHNPKTVRKNSGADYHGCLRIEVRRSSVLYRQIEGWAHAAMTTGLTEAGDLGAAQPG
jgi:DNA-binding CsgD family transcriptional regulator